MRAPARAAFVTVVALACALSTPTRVRADDERLMLGVEGAYFSPTQRLSAAAYSPGGTLSVAAELSLTPWLIPLVRVRGALVGGASGNVDGRQDVGSLGSVSAGVRFRPRGIAHPEETSRASCVWAEIDAGIALWNGRLQPTFEVALGFTSEAGDVDLGPVFRFVHVLPMSAADGTDVFSMTIGLELIFGDRRAASAP